MSVLILASATFAASAHAQYTTVSAQSLLACPQWIGGDKEFHGNGPDTTADVILKPAPDRKSIQVQLILHQIETRSDWSEGQIDRTWTIANAPTNMTYTAVWNGSSWMPITAGVEIEHKFINYTDTNTTLEVFYSQGDFWYSKVEINGDTVGDDLGYGCANLPTDSYMRAFFPTLYFLYQ
jgi:hypothetical protein